MLQFFTAFLGRSTGHVKERPLTPIHVTFADLMLRVTKIVHPWKYPTSMQEQVRRFSSSVVKVSEPHCKRGVFTSKFHLRDNLREDVMRFTPLDFIDAADFEHFNVHIMQSYRGNSQTSWKSHARNILPYGRLHQSFTMKGIRCTGSGSMIIPEPTLWQNPVIVSFSNLDLIRKRRHTSWQMMYRFRSRNWKHLYHLPCADFMASHRSDSLLTSRTGLAVIHMVSCCIHTTLKFEALGNSIPNLVTVTLTQTGYLLGGWVPGIKI